MAVLAIVGGAVAAASSIAGATIGGIGAYQQQRQMEANADAQQEAMNRNARLEEMEANTALAETEEADRRQRAEAERIRATQRALYGKSGVAITAGSPLAVLGETAANQEMESLDLRRAGATEYNRRMSQAANYRYQGRIAGSSVGGNALLGAVGSALPGLGKGIGQGLGVVGDIITYGKGKAAAGTGTGSTSSK